jgi:hypothetical protein
MKRLLLICSLSAFASLPSLAQSAVPVPHPEAASAASKEHTVIDITREKTTDVRAQLLKLEEITKEFDIQIQQELFTSLRRRSEKWQSAYSPAFRRKALAAKSFRLKAGLHALFLIPPPNAKPTPPARRDSL